MEETLFTSNIFCGMLAEALKEPEETLYMAGVVELQDRSEKPLTKQAAARMAHKALIWLGEPDERDAEKAFGLKDIYDCHTCVAHVAQCFVKGIIGPSAMDVFGMQIPVDKESARSIIMRLTDKNARIPVS